MNNIINHILKESGNAKGIVMVTILDTKGSSPQVQGASAIFSGKQLKAGTLGGGILEGDATVRSAEIINKNSSRIYDFHLNANITDNQGAICGGIVTLLLDADPLKSQKVFQNIKVSLGNGTPGVLATIITGKNKVKIERFWFENGIPQSNEIIDLSNEMSLCLEKKECLFLQKSPDKIVFLQALSPLPQLVIAGAGHIGKALSHLAKLLDFEVTVIDDRPEYANPYNIPDADHIIVNNIGESIARTKMTPDTYIVIVSRGHHDDSEALKACINSEVRYIGMIGSKRKVTQMRENFIRQTWSTDDRFDRVHAPVGLEINSRTVQEIAVSICAQLVQVRNQERVDRKSPEINAVILAAGASERMGKPKMLLPFGDKTIIEKVVSSANRSSLNHIIVVLGAEADPISRVLEHYPVKTVFNPHPENGMLSSIQCGLKSLPEETGAVMILLGDQPMIGNSVIDKVLCAFKKSGKNIIVAGYGRMRGHPILIGKKYINEILDLSLDKSLKDLLHKYPGDIEEVETGSPEILRDIDTQQEYLEELKNKNKYD